MDRMRRRWIISSIRRVFQGRSIFIEVTILFLILCIAFFVRILPLRWGLYLSEFDPWMQYREMMYVVERGWSGFLEFSRWHDYESWYPYGRDVGKTAFPGLPFLAAFIYHLINGVGFHVDPLELASFLPPIMGTLAVFLAFLLGRELGGKPTGFFAGFLMALSNASIGRTHLGWFDDESVSIPFMMLGFLTYLLAIKKDRSWRSLIIYSIISGVSLGYVTASWGASRFPIMFIPIFTGFIALIGRYRRKLLVSYSITALLYTSIAVMVPKLGLDFLREATVITSIAVFIYLTSFEVRKLRPNLLGNLPHYVLIGGLIALVSLVSIGSLGLPGLKFLSTVVPTLRSTLPIVISVAENQISTWAVLFSDAGFKLFLLPAGVYYLLKRREDIDIFMVLLTLFVIYFASTMVRLTILAAPAIAIVAGYGLAEIFRGLAHNIRVTYSKKEKVRSIGVEYYILTPIIITILLTVNLVPAVYGFRYSISAIDAGYSPPTVVSSSLPVKSSIADWLRALSWMRDNLPNDAVVASWWDYGYWITILGNHTSLVDNATLNTTHIGEVAYAFMSDEETAYRVFKKLGATHVLIFVTHGGRAGASGSIPTLLGYGDEAKWIWMLRIAKQVGYQFNEEDYLDERGNPTSKFWSETLLGQLIPYKPQQVYSGVTGHVYQPSTLNHFLLIYGSSEPYSSFAYIYIYEIVD
ncbi:MAG: STT3 domain-containing protein [Candidatus Caldarchaeales archaeon]